MISTLNEINSQGIFTIILCVVLVLLLIVEGTKLWKGTLESLDLKSGKELRENAVNERIDALERELENVEEQMALEDVDSETIWKDLQELRDFVKQWNDKQDYTYYETTDIQVVPSDKLIKDCIEEYKD